MHASKEIKRKKKRILQNNDAFKMDGIRLYRSPEQLERQLLFVSSHSIQ